MTTSPSQIARRRVLIIEDDRLLAEAMGEAIRDDTTTVDVIARSGAAARLCAGQVRYAALIVALEPATSSSALLRFLAKLGEAPPIIAWSRRPSNAARPPTGTPKLARVLESPVTVGALRAAIAEALERAAS